MPEATSPVHMPETDRTGEREKTFGRDLTVDKPAEHWGHEDAEQKLFSLCVTSVQPDALGLVAKSFGGDSGKYKFPF